MTRRAPTPVVEPHCRSCTCYSRSERPVDTKAPGYALVIEIDRIFAEEALARTEATIAAHRRAQGEVRP